MKLEDLEAKLGVADMSEEEKLALVKDIQANIPALKAEQRVLEAKTQANLVVEAIKKIKEGLESRFDELNGIVDVKVRDITSGKDGIDGKDGKDGVNGKDGVDGISITGPKGDNGADGQDGVGVQDAHIDFDGSLIITLTDGKELNVGEVVPFDVAEKIKVISNGGGTSQSVLDSLTSLQTQINTLTGIDGVLGTIAQQDANAVAITGGTIDGTTVGATTASTGAFTTLSASSTVSGTGFSTYLASPPAIGGTIPAAGTFTTLAVAGGLQNLFLQSQTLNTTPWALSQVTINQTATTAPDSTTTGNSIIPTAVNSIHRISQAATITAGITYTASVYAKANGYNYLFFNCNSGFNATATFNLSTGTISTIGFGTATITSVGNGWYRCTITGTASVSVAAALYLQVNSTVTTATDDTFTGNGTSGIFLWGAQLETSPTVHVYQVTTTVAASANPVISLSGGGTIGLQSDGSIYETSAGTGSIKFYTNNTLEQLRVTNTASAVNYVQVTGAATGGTPTISSQGSDANPNVAIFPKGLGIVLMNQQTPTAVTATGTLTIANLLTQIVTSTSATAVALTLPTGTLSDAGVSGGTSAVNTSFNWSIINTGSAVGDVTVLAGTAHTIVGSATVAVGTSGSFRSRKTATNTFVTYRV